MIDTLTLPLTLAQETVRPAPAPGGSPVTSSAPAAGAAGEGGTVQSADGQQLPATRSSSDPFGTQFFFIMLAVLLIMIIFSMRSSSKEKRKRQDLLSALAKGDRVQTVGGIIGTVVEVRDDHLVLKVDENNNTRIKITKGAVQARLEDKAD